MPSLVLRRLSNLVLALRIIKSVYNKHIIDMDDATKNDLRKLNCINDFDMI